MTHFTRTINISCENLGGRWSPTLILTFDNQPMDGIYQGYFPVVWKVSTFPKEGAYAMTATYKNQLMFVNPQIKDNKVISAATSVKINPGQQTDLIEQAGSTKSFTPPTDGAGRCIKAINKTQALQTIGVGFDNGDTPPSTMLVFDRIPSAYNVTAEFTPILSAYITEGYEENSVLRGEILEPVIWRQNLADLKETSNWRLTVDYATGIYSINPA